MGLKKKVKNKYWDIEKKVSKKYNIDFDYFSRNFFWSNLMILTNMFLAFILNLFLIKMLPVAEYGRWQWFLTIFTLSGVFALSGFDIIGRKSFLENYYSSFFRITRIRIIALLFASFCFLCAAAYSYFYYPNLWPYFIVLCFAVHLYNLRLYPSYLYSKDNFRVTSFTGSIKNIIFTTVTIIFLLLKFQLIYIFLVYYGVQLIFDLIMTIYYWNIIKLKENTTSEDPNLMNLGFKFTLINFIPNISGLDKFIMPIYLSLEDLGYYSIALFFPILIFGLLQKLSYNLFFKKIKGISKKQITRFFLTKGILLFIVYLIFCLLSFFVIYFIFKYYFNINNLQLVIYSVVILISGFFWVGTEIIRNYYSVSGDTKRYTKVEIISSILNLVLIFLLIPFFGLLGAVIAKFSFNFIKFLMYLFMD